MNKLNTQQLPLFLLLYSLRGKKNNNIRLNYSLRANEWRGLLGYVSSCIMRARYILRERTEYFALRATNTDRHYFWILDLCRACIAHGFRLCSIEIDVGPRSSRSVDIVFFVAVSVHLLWLCYLWLIWNGMLPLENIRQPLQKAKTKGLFTGRWRIRCDSHSGVPSHS